MLKNMLRYLSLDTICSSKLTALFSRKLFAYRTPISFPEPSLPLASGTGKRELWEQRFWNQPSISFQESSFHYSARKKKLGLPRGHDSWCWAKGTRPLETRMIRILIHEKKRNFALFSQSLVKDNFSADTYAAITSSGFCMPAVTKEYFQNKKNLKPEVTNFLSKTRL